MPERRVKDGFFATLRLARPHVALLAAMYTVLGAYLTGNVWSQHAGDVMKAALVIALIVAFGFIINDYHDIDLDRLSKPYRPIPSGRLSARFALVLACTSAALAILVAATMGGRSAVVGLILVACSAVYSYFLKPTLLLGIAMVAFLNAGAVLYGCMAVGALTPAAVMLTVLALLNASAQETLYNLIDRVEDARSGVMTTAVRLGREATLTLFSVLALGCAAATVAPWTIHLGSKGYIWAALPCSTIPLVGIVIFVRRQATEDTLRAAHSIMKLVRISSVLPVLFLR
ncbi:MAG: UbiA family prenyltransferase [Chloroflexota bacterium]